MIFFENFSKGDKIRLGFLFRCQTPSGHFRGSRGKSLKTSLALVSVWGFTLSLVLLLSGQALSQDFPTKPITIYNGFEAGGATDVSARAMASELERLLGVPVVVENKPGGGATVCATLVASKKPDGYTLGIGASGVISLRPHLLKLAYDPLKDFTPLVQFSKYLGGLVVLNEAPYKDIQEFIEHAKRHPGMSYSSSGMYSQAHLSTIQLATCKGLQLKHVPFKGGAPADTALLGKHVDFVASGDRSIRYLKQGVMRMLLAFNPDARDPFYPEVPTLKDLGCRGIPALGYLVFAPKGLPDPISKKLGGALKKVVEGSRFQKALKDLDLVYDFRERSQLEKDLPHEYEEYRLILNEVGVKRGTAP